MTKQGGGASIPPPPWGRMPELPPFAALEDIEAASWTEAHEHASPSYRERVGFQVQRIGGAISIFAREDIAAYNRVWLPGDARTVSARALFEIIGHAQRLGRRRFIAHCPAWAADPTWMMEHGFELRSTVVKLFRRPSMDVPDGPFRVEELGPWHAADAGRIASAGYELEPWMGEGFTCSIGQPGWKHYGAFDDRTLIATALLRVRGEYAWLGLASTLAEHRGRGAQISLLYRRIRDAAAAGCTWLVAEAMADGPSLRNQQRAGFEVAYERPNYLVDLR